MTQQQNSAETVRAVCEEWVAAGRGDECFWEPWDGCPCSTELTPNMVLSVLSRRGSAETVVLPALMAEAMAIRVSDAHLALLSLLLKLENSVDADTYKMKTTVAVAQAKAAHLEHVVDLLRGKSQH